MNSEVIPIIIILLVFVLIVLIFRYVSTTKQLRKSLREDNFCVVCAVLFENKYYDFEEMTCFKHSMNYEFKINKFVKVK